MFKIVNNVSFKTTIKGQQISEQIAFLLNLSNSLKVFHTGDTIIKDIGKYLIYLNNDEVLACTAIRQEEAKVTRNYHTSVLPSYRRKGLGNLMVKKAIEESDTPFIFATIRKDNTKSINLYKKNNFVYVKDENINVIIMGKRK